MRLRTLSLVMLALSACSTGPEPVPPPQIAPPSPIVAPPILPPDTCGARDLQYLIGRPRTEAPVPVRPERQRVACTTCPVALDFDESRLNIFFDAATGAIREIRCG